MPRKVIAKRLGELLVERKVITPEQLESALKIQQAKGGLLGQILVSLGFATEEAVAQAVTTQYGFPYLPLKSYTIDPELLCLIPENVARQYCLVPVDRIGDALTIAMADPLDAQVIEDIEMLSHCSVQVFVATMSDVADAIQRHYGENHAGE
jgi:type IV pilus assembly protein PilB